MCILLLRCAQKSWFYGLEDCVLHTSHEASAPATGYLFQCRYALLAGLRATIDTPNVAISIERFDDIAFEADGEPTELIQTKHHVRQNGNLTDASADLWKTLLICILPRSL
jgi:hypothetical protein